MGRNQRRNALVAEEADQLVKHYLGSARVEVTGRLVGEDELRIVGERTADRGALLLAARKLRRAMIEAVGKPDRTTEGRARAAAPPCGSGPGSSAE